MNKRNYKVILILAFVLFLSVGYAEDNSVSLTITGTAGVGSEALDVYFTENTEVSNSAKVTAIASDTSVIASVSNITLSNDYFEMSINEGSIYSGVGESAVLFVPQSNVEDINYKIEFLVTTGYGTENLDSTTDKTYNVNACEKNVLMVTIKMNKTPIVSLDSTFDFSKDIKFNSISSLL